MDKESDSIIRPPIINPSTRLESINFDNIHLVAEFFVTKTELANALFEELKWQLQNQTEKDNNVK